MIFSTNRTTSLSDDIAVDVNESYFGAGAFTFAEECAQDELAIFENAIKSDIDEVLIGESATELQALNEGFVQSAINKIKELMKKFIAWLESVSRSAIAKLSQLLVRDNKHFCKIARRQIAKMKNQGKFKAEGTIINFSDAESALDDLYDMADPDGDIKDDMPSLSDIIEKVTTKNADINLNTVSDHLKFLEALDSKALGKIRKEVKKEKADAAKVLKKAEEKLNKVKDDDAAGKEAAQKEVEKAAKFKETAQKALTLSLQVIKKLIKIARAVVAKAMGASPKNEAYGWDDEDLATAMLESMELEYDEALEEMSEAKDCSDDDDDDLDDDED